MIKTEQEIARLRIANEIAAQAMHHVRRRARAGDEGVRGGRALAGLRARAGHGARRRRARAARSRSSGPARGSRRSRRPADLPVVEGEPVLFEIWVCADGYWADHTKNLVRRRAQARVRRARGAAAGGVRRGARARAHPAGRWPSWTESVREGSPSIGYPGQPSHPICHGVGARAHEPPYPHQAARRHVRGEHGARGRARRVLGGRRRPAGRGQLPRHGGRRSRSSRRSRTGWCAVERRDLDRRAERRVPRRRQRRALRHDAARRRADRRRRARSRSRSSRSRSSSTSSASTGSRPASRASRRTTGTP